MANNKAVVTAALTFSNDAVSAKSLSVQNLTFVLTGIDYVAASMTVPATAGGVVLPLGGLTGALGWLMIKNFDAAIYVQVYNAVSGTLFAKVPPLGAILVFLDASVTAPAVRALDATLTANIEYLLTKA